MGIRPPIWLADVFVRHPAAPIAVAMMLGVVGGRLVAPAVPWLSVAAAAVAIVFAIFTFGRAWICSIALLIGIALASVACTQVVAFRFPVEHITHFVADDARLCRLRLYLPNEPRLRHLTFGLRFPSPPRQVTLAQVTQVLTRSGWVEASGDVLVQIHQPHPQLAAGQTVEVLGMIERPGIAMNPGQFDWQRYYRDIGVLNSVQVRRAENLTILASDPAPLLTRWREEVRSLLARGFAPDRKLDLALITALVLGDYDPELRDVKEQFRRTGTSHHLAISGMHVALVGGLVFLLVRLAGAGPRVCWIAAMVVVGFYGCVAVPSPPVLRAVILFMVAGLAFLLARFSSAIQLLMLTVVVMLAIHPLDAFNAGFQLSFGTVLGLILLSEPLAARWAGEDHVLLRSEIELLPRRERTIRWIDRHGLQTLCAGVVAWAVSMPLVAWHFTQLNPWQVPASIILAPFVTLSLFAGVFKIALTWLIPSLAEAIAVPTAGASAWMRGIVSWLARAPYADVPLTAPSWWIMILCWIALAVAVVRWRLPGMRVGSIALLVSSFAYMLISPYWLGGVNSLRAGQMRVTLMAVGAGQCALVEPAGGRTVLIDCGSTSLTDLNSNVVVPVLRELGHTSLDSVFISHANTDHYSGVAEIADAYGVREVIVGDGFEASAATTASGETMLRSLRAIDRPPRVARPGDRIPLGKDSYIEILWPDAGTRLDDNDRSLVARLVKGDRSILFTGDIQAAGMQALLDRDVPLSADVLVAMHHGSSEDVSPAFVKAVAPSWILSSNDRTLTGKQRRFDVMMGGRRLLRTHEYGAITILIDADGTLHVDGFVKAP